MKRVSFFGANWKMYKNKSEAIDYFNAVKNWDKTDKEVVFFIPFHLLIPMKEMFPGVKIGAQNFYFKDEGAFTGEISSKMLVEDGIEYAIIGHSERRKIFKEDNDLIREKIMAGLRYKMKIVLCVGEDLEERGKGLGYEVIKEQLSVLDGQVIRLDSLIIAYEPVWAIGTGKVAKSEYIEEVHSYIRDLLNNKGIDGDNIRIIYGGSVNQNNIKEIMLMPNVDGCLVGSASLSPETFKKIVFFEN